MYLKDLIKKFVSSQKRSKAKGRPKAEPYRCTKCGRTLPPGCFYLCSRTGRPTTRCKECLLAANRAYRQTPTGQQAVRRAVKRRKARWVEHPEEYEIYKQKCREYKLRQKTGRR